MKKAKLKKPERKEKHHPMFDLQKAEVDGFNQCWDLFNAYHEQEIAKYHKLISKYMVKEACEVLSKDDKALKKIIKKVYGEEEVMSKLRTPNESE